MQELDKCAELAKAIKEKDEDIFELKSRIMSAGCQVITGMPRSAGTPIIKADLYLIRLERLEAERTRLYESLKNTWREAKTKLQVAGVKGASAFFVLKLRFYHGYEWDMCAAKMKEAYPNEKWSLSKCYRVYRSILHKIECESLCKMRIE